MTRLPGIALADCLPEVSDAELRAISSQLQDFVGQIRAVPRKVGSGYAICNSLGGPIEDTRIRWGDPVGPFEDEASFNQMLRNSDDAGRNGHETVFTQADLNPRNILVDLLDLPEGRQGLRVTGIVDWEFAGFYPEYWEYTKSLFEGFGYPDRLPQLYHGLFRQSGDYSKEFAIEKQSWGEGDG